MNILPKKSWHVRSKKNIERVHQDEAEAAKTESLERERKLRAEQEARIRELRARAGIPEPQRGHINLFEESQDHQQSRNRDHEKEKQDDEARWQQKVGLLKKLVRAEDVNKPWYCNKVESLGQNDPVEFRQKQKDVKSSSKPDLILSIYDPMSAIEEAKRVARLVEENRRKKLLDQAQLQDYDFYKNVPPPKPTGSVAKKADSNLPTQSIESDSSPEIIKIVRSNRSRLAKEVRSIQKSDKKHKCKKTRKEKKSSHHKHHRHRHKKHKS